MLLCQAKEDKTLYIQVNMSIIHTPNYCYIYYIGNHLDVEFSNLE